MGSGPAKAAAGLGASRCEGALWWETQPAAGEVLQEKGV